VFDNLISDDGGDAMAENAELMSYIGLGLFVCAFMFLTQLVELKRNQIVLVKSKI